MPQYLALITILSDGNAQPPGIWGGGNVPMPTPPIYLPPGTGTPQPPLGIWGGAPIPVPTPPIYLPPTTPQPPLVIWGPNDPRPENPIVIPPGGIGPGVPTHPIFLPVFPTHPIVLPDPGEPPSEEKPPLEVKVGWTAETGWVVVLVPTGAHPTPSR